MRGRVPVKEEQSRTKRHLDELTSERRQVRVQPQLAEEDAQILRAYGVLGLGADADAVVSP